MIDTKLISFIRCSQNPLRMVLNALRGRISGKVNDKYSFVNDDYV